MIKGDKYMPETTMRAIASMIDALAQAINRGEVKPPNYAHGDRARGFSPLDFGATERPVFNPAENLLA